MPITYAVDSVRQLVRVHWRGVVDDDSLRAHLHVLVLDANARACGRSVTDAREATIAVNGEHIHHLIRQIISPGLDGQPWRVGMVVDSPVQFGVMRQFQAYAAGTLLVEIFDDIAEAERWALEDPEG